VALVSGDKLCNTRVIPKVLNIEGKVRRPDANIVKDITGYSIGGVSPIGLPEGISIIMDTSLKRFDKIWSAAGHTHCVFPATFEELKYMTGAEVSELISQEKEE
jgi:prolyl-tRNA editing enzyme YbaK/EbsC (Cys-tRNA(Pro) deacylase)